MTERPDDLLILLVGSNPLPNYLAGCALRPNRIALVFTKETKDAKDRLRDQLAQTLVDKVRFEDVWVDDATCSTEVRRVIDRLMSSDGNRDVSLHYTGGTKIMAVHARMAFKCGKGKPERASYLDEGGKENPPRLRFDSNTSKLLSEYPTVRLDLKSLLALHGIAHEPRKPKDPAPTLADARDILCKGLENVPLLDTLYEERKRLEKFGNPKNAVSNPFRANCFGLTLSLSEFPTNVQLEGLESADKKKSWFKQWYSFIGGEWLEDWLGGQIRALAKDLNLDLEKDITIGVNAKRIGAKKEDPPMEIDLSVVCGHRSYFVSCTTDTTKRQCKSKLFEMSVRSRQLGGDLARAALVCLADDGTVSALQSDINDVWGATNTTKVFGLSDIRDWSDFGGKQPNRCSLKQWLES